MQFKSFFSFLRYLSIWKLCPSFSIVQRRLKNNVRWILKVNNLDVKGFFFFFFFFIHVTPLYCWKWSKTNPSSYVWLFIILNVGYHKKLRLSSLSQGPREIGFIGGERRGHLSLPSPMREIKLGCRGDGKRPWVLLLSFIIYLFSNCWQFVVLNFILINFLVI